MRLPAGSRPPARRAFSVAMAWTSPLSRGTSSPGWVAGTRRPRSWTPGSPSTHRGAARSTSPRPVAGWMRCAATSSRPGGGSRSPTSWPRGRSMRTWPDISRALGLRPRSSTAMPRPRSRSPGTGSLRSRAPTTTSSARRSSCSPSRRRRRSPRAPARPRVLPRRVPRLRRPSPSSSPDGIRPDGGRSPRPRGGRSQPHGGRVGPRALGRCGGPIRGDPGSVRRLLRALPVSRGDPAARRDQGRCRSAPPRRRGRGGRPRRRAPVPVDRDPCAPGARAHGPTRTDRARAGARTPAGRALGREIEVLRLVADGRSNGEIGEALFISRKTAGVHVTHILDKLGVANRVEAAMAAGRLGLLEDPGEDQ